MRVVVSDVVVAFGPLTVIDAMSLEAPAGQMTALAGPSGSGKTSMLAIIAGAVRPREGAVQFFHGGNVLARKAVRIAWISQNASILPDRSAIDNVAIAGLARGNSIANSNEMARGYLDELGLGGRAAAPARLLSGGEQQRLAFARALCADADLILADEPTANLDPLNTAVLCARLKAVSGSATIIVATHDPQLIAVCDTVYQMGGVGQSHAEP